MKKAKLFIALLLVSIGCVGNISIAATVPSKNVTDGHKKNKPVRKTSISHQRQMSEKDITECTQLIKRVAQTDKMIQTEMIATSANNSKIAEHLKKPAAVQLFASDDPAAIAHLTGKSANLPIPSAVKQTAKATPIAVPKPVAQLAPLPIFKPTTATLVATSKTSKYVARQPTNTKTFVSNDLTGKTLAVKPNQPIAKSIKPTTLQAQPPHPHIELFAPNPQADLNHLEGRSANLATLQKTAPADKSTTAAQKTQKPTHSSKKASVSAGL